MALDESGGAGDEYAHVRDLRISFETNLFP
jgi:hypothetical protein